MTSWERSGFMSPLSGLAIGAIKLYQLLISPLLGKRCRFYPTCSQYSIEAIKKYGFLKGSLLGFKRIVKCGPWHPGGYDPLP
jgi:hypothetical protein